MQTIILARHGGLCCGASHIRSFGVEDTDENIKCLTILTTEAKCEGRLLEIVLNNHQMRSLPRTIKVMKELGWIRTAVWYNDNSGNHCNQFVYHKKAADMDTVDY